MNPLAKWRAWLTARRLARVLERAEHRREVIKRQIEARVEAKAQRSRHRAMLFDATCVSLAASAGRRWNTEAR